MQRRLFPLPPFYFFFFYIYFITVGPKIIDLLFSICWLERKPLHLHFTSINHPVLSLVRVNTCVNPPCFREAIRQERGRWHHGKRKLRLHLLRMVGIIFLVSPIFLANYLPRSVVYLKESCVSVIIFVPLPRRVTRSLLSFPLPICLVEILRRDRVSSFSL